MSELTIEDTWFVTGMKGTGSNTVVADGVFVPAHRFVSVFKLLGGANDNPYKDEVLYRAPFMPGGTIVLAGPHLGLARAALDLVIEKASTRGIAYTFYDVQADAPITQLAVAKAAALIDVAELLAATIGPRELPCPRGARLRQRVTGPEVGAVPAPGSAGRLGGRSS
ncbi:MAG: oxidoreductase, partial [Pseudonocardiales bacterium]|nr:oxidoreductase [Pseudonocardiales bacterium]